MNRRACKAAQSTHGLSLASLVRSYRIHNRARAVDELRIFRDLPTLEVAIHHAALAIDDRGKRFSHQCRIARAALERGSVLLRAGASGLTGCKSFQELHARLSSMFSEVSGLGELYVYDTALRLGAFLRLSPERVYLHAGTRAGARGLGLDVSAGVLDANAFPQVVQQLAPHEIEDFLCIYRDQLKDSS